MGRKPTFAIFISGSGTNAEKLLSDPAVLEAADPVVLVTDAPEKSRTGEIAEKYNLPVIAVDIRKFYQLHGLQSTSLATGKGREVRELWTDEIRKQLKEYNIDFIVLAGFESLCNIADDYPCLNVHPGDLSVLDKDGNRCYVGLHSKPVEAALLAGETSLCSSVIIALPYNDVDKDVDNGILLGISDRVAVDFDGLTLEEMKNIRAARKGKKPAGGWGDKLEQLAQKMQEKLKIQGDHVILPLVVRDFARRCFAYADKQLYYRPTPEMEFELVTDNGYNADGTRKLPEKKQQVCSTSRKKFKFLKFFLIPAVIALALAGGGIYLWKLPQRRADIVKKEFLLPYQKELRVKNIMPEDFNTCNLQGIELGPGDTVLFSSPLGKIELDTSSSEKHMIKSLHLEDVNVIFDPGKFTFNNMTVEQFLQSFLTLPDDLCGGIPLHIRGQFVLPDQKIHSKFALKISGTPTVGKLTLQCNWQSITDKHAGNWVINIDRKNPALDFVSEGDLDLQLLKKVMSKAQIREQILDILSSAALTGKLKISSAFPALTVESFEFDGRINNADIKWYKQKISKLPAFNILLKKQQNKLFCSIPELTIKNPFGVMLKKIRMEQNISGNLIKFTALCDLRQTAINALCHLMGYQEIPTNSTMDNISGSWNMRTHSWKITGKTYNNYYQDQLSLNSRKTPWLELQPQNITFKASGKGDSGKISEFKFDFFNLGFKNDSLECLARQGKVDIKVAFGKTDVLSPDTVSFFLQDVKFKSASFSGSAPHVAGQLDLRKHADSRRELQISCNGGSGELTTGDGKADFSRWNCQIELDSATTIGDWHIPRFVFNAPDFKFNTTKQTMQIRNMRLHGSGRMTQCRMIHCDTTINAESIVSEQSNIVKPVLKIKYDTAKAESLRYHVDFFCRHGVMLAPWRGIRKITNCSMIFDCGSFSKLPTKLTLKASELDYIYQQLSMKLHDTVCTLDQRSDNAWDSRVKFSSARLALPPGKYGSGSFSQGEFLLNINTDAQGNITQFNITGESAHPSWNFRTMSVGGEKLQTYIAFQKNKQPELSGKLEILNANILDEYFTASTPRLATDIAADSLNSISGVTSFVQGNISSKQGDLELKKASFELPWLISDQQPAKLVSGKFTSAELWYKQRLEGEFSGSLQHLLLLPGVAARYAQHNLKISGVLKTEIFSKAPADVTLDIQLPPAVPGMKLSMQLPPSPLSKPLFFNRYIQLPSQVNTLSGILGIKFDIAHSGGTEKAALQLALHNADLQIDNLKLQNCNTRLKLDRQNENITIVPAQLQIGTLQWKKWSLADNEILFSLNNQKLQINSWRGKVLDGTFKLAEAIKTDLPQSKNSTLDMQFEIAGIPAEKFFKQINIDSIHSNLELSGTLSPSLDGSNNKIYFKESPLTARSSKGEQLKITPDNRSKIRFADIRYKDFSLAVFKNMICNRARFVLTMLPGDFSIKVNAEGFPAAPVPFVFQGSQAKQPFRPTEPGETGFAGELELNMNFSFASEDPGI